MNYPALSVILNVRPFQIFFVRRKNQAIDSQDFRRTQKEPKEARVESCQPRKVIFFVKEGKTMEGETVAEFKRFVQATTHAQ